MEAGELAALIDHTLLTPDAKEADFTLLCQQALEFGFFSVCVPLEWVKHCRQELASTPALSETKTKKQNERTLNSVKIATVVGFPSGAESIEAKLAQSVQARSLDVDEIDMVLNRQYVFNFQYEKLFEEISSVVNGFRPHNAARSSSTSDKKTVKVILEISELNDLQISAASAIAMAAGADFVKTSTGFSQHGARCEAVALMRKIVGPEKGVKASGGIKNLEDALNMIAAGANRLGLSRSVAIVGELMGEKKPTSKGALKDIGTSY
ncbi:MAG: deoxyribose-phosphate aldolase [Bdellovibrionales bacterium CG10_big_fil_rev_8_21_14_0_10_45_34]|nr:MAG: deoxyribose-phosphate aldolase [Bdellovibrionales bacterium CG10_big_fil_rev_8_21_14_0_10_45_34]